jgi:hypothetical protein
MRTPQPINSFHCIFNATFNNISVISWWPDLAVEKPGHPERTTDHVQATGKLYHLWLWLSYYSLPDVDIAIEKNKLIYPSHPAFNVSCYTIVCFVNRCLSFFFWPLCCLSFFDLLIMVTMLLNTIFIMLIHTIWMMGQTKKLYG